MSRTRFRPDSYASWLLILASLIGVVLAMLDYVSRGDGIAYSPGALLVLVSTVLILAASMVVIVDIGLPTWLGGALYALIILGLIGTALAAWFLDSYWLMALMIIGLLGCLAKILVSSAKVDFATRASGMGGRS